MATALRINEPWDSSEVEALRRLRDEGRSWRQIGEALGRTHKACQQRWYLTKALDEAAVSNGSEPEPEPGPAPPTFDLDQLLLTCDVLTKQLDALPQALRTMVLDWLNKQYR